MAWNLYTDTVMKGLLFVGVGTTNPSPTPILQGQVYRWSPVYHVSEYFKVINLA